MSMSSEHAMLTLRTALVAVILTLLAAACGGPETETVATGLTDSQPPTDADAAPSDADNALSTCEERLNSDGWNAVDLLIIFVQPQANQAQLDIVEATLGGFDVQFVYMDQEAAYTEFQEDFFPDTPELTGLIELDDFPSSYRVDTGSLSAALVDEIASTAEDLPGVRKVVVSQTREELEESCRQTERMCNALTSWAEQAPSLIVFVEPDLDPAAIDEIIATVGDRATSVEVLTSEEARARRAPLFEDLGFDPVVPVSRFQPETAFDEIHLTGIDPADLEAVGTDVLALSEDYPLLSPAAFTEELRSIC